MFFVMKQYSRKKTETPQISLILFKPSIFDKGFKQIIENKLKSS